MNDVVINITVGFKLTAHKENTVITPVAFFVFI